MTQQKPAADDAWERKKAQWLAVLNRLKQGDPEILRQLTHAALSEKRMTPAEKKQHAAQRDRDIQRLLSECAPEQLAEYQAQMAQND